jgi:hypothetical protein
MASLLDQTLAQRRVKEVGDPISFTRTLRQPRITLLSPWFPEPIDNGSKVRLRLIIDALSADYELMLIALLPPDTLDSEPYPAVYQAYGDPSSCRCPTFVPGH